MKLALKIEVFRDEKCLIFQERKQSRVYAPDPEPKSTVHAAAFNTHRKDPSNRSGQLNILPNIYICFPVTSSGTRGTKKRQIFAASLKFLPLSFPLCSNAY